MRAPDFASASKQVLAFLHERTGVAAGDVLRRADTFCARMVRGGGPRIAPRVDAAGTVFGTSAPATQWTNIPASARATDPGRRAAMTSSCRSPA